MMSGMFVTRNWNWNSHYAEARARVYDRLVTLGDQMESRGKIATAGSLALLL